MPLKAGGIFGITAISIFFINEEFKFVEKLSVLMKEWKGEL